MKVLFFIKILLIAASVNATTETILDIPSQISFNDVKQKVESKKYQMVLTDLDYIIKNAHEQDRSLASFAAGFVASKLEKHDLSLGYLSEPLLAPHLQSYTHYLRGKAYFHKRQFNVAKAYFDKALEADDVSRDLKDEINFLSGQVALKAKKSSRAYRKLNPLVRRWRGSSRRAELLEILLEASLKKKVFRTGRYCKWFKDLYVDHPTNQYSNKWGFKGKNLEFKGVKINCKLTAEHKRSKLKRFYLEGLNNEILIKLKEIKGDKKEYKSLQATFYYYTGKPKKALGLLKTVKEYKDEYKEKLKLARTAYYAGEVDYALSVYKGLLQKEKRSHRKAWLLYQQASLSAELSNFQNAETFYSRLIKDFSGYKYGRRALWKQPWTMFLSGKHKKAYEGFHKFKKLQERSPRRYSFVQKDQVDYWSARALQKSGRELEAVQILKKLAIDPSVSYYSILSALRLEEIAQKNSLQLSAMDFLNRPWMQKNQVKEKRLAKFLKDFETPKRHIASLAAEPILPAVLDQTKLIQEEDQDPFAEYQMYSDSFVRSADLNRLGLLEESKNELKFVRLKAKTKNLKKRLLEQFTALEDFSSLSRLAALSFFEERKSKKGKDSLIYWKQAYPLAYKNHVEKNARVFDVSSALIWGIMRAESFFDPKILSPVGARGLLQVMPYTAAKLQALMIGDDPMKIRVSSKKQTHISESLLLPEINLRYGAKYLSRLDKQFTGHLPFIAAAYNAGPHRVKLWSSRFLEQSQDEFTERVPFKETKAYIKKVMRNMFIYSSLYGVGLDVSFLIKPPTYIHKDRVPFAEYWGEI